MPGDQFSKDINDINVIFFFLFYKTMSADED